MSSKCYVLEAVPKVQNGFKGSFQFYNSFPILLAKLVINDAANAMITIIMMTPTPATDTLNSLDNPKAVAKICTNGNRHLATTAANGMDIPAPKPLFQFGSVNKY